MGSTYTCALCHEEFKKAWSDEEADAEYAAVFPKESANAESRDVVCDDCYNIILGRN